MALQHEALLLMFSHRMTSVEHDRHQTRSTRDHDLYRGWFDLDSATPRQAEELTSKAGVNLVFKS